MRISDRDKSGSKKTSFFYSEAATSTVIGAVLLLGIIFSVFAIIQIGYVPEWKSDAEYSHMNDVWEDMADLKSKIDMMTIILASKPNSAYINSSNPGSSTHQLVMSVPFHMGGGDIPFISPVKSSGSLAVNKNKCTLGIIVYPKNPDPKNNNTYSKLINCSTITYNSQNRDYVDESFSYECGALILSQRDRSNMMLYPSILFSRTPTNQYNVSINAVRIFQKPYFPPEVISSNTECSLRLTGLDYRPLYDSNKDGSVDRLELTVYTSHPEAWKQYLEKSIEEADIDPGEYDLVLGGSNNVSLTFPSKTRTSSLGTSIRSLERLYVSETVVKAEPGIGLS